jgi:glutathione peroxidase-family protein
VILGFPSRQFAWQEYKTDEAIAEFARKKNFPGIMMQLGKVKGKEAPELWKFFKTETGAKSPKWNFQGKFLISKSGNVSVSNTKNLEADIERLIEEEYEEDLEYLEFIEAVTNVWQQ